MEQFIGEVCAKSLYVHLACVFGDLGSSRGQLCLLYLATFSRHLVLLTVRDKNLSSLEHHSDPLVLGHPLFVFTLKGIM